MSVNPLRAQPRDAAQHRAISSRFHSSRHHRSAARALLACAVTAAVACAARADEYWVGTSGNWDASLWSTSPSGSPTLPPPTSGNAFISFNDTLTRVVTFDHAGVGPSLSGLTIDNRGGGLSVLAQTQGTMTASSLSIGTFPGGGEYDLYGGTLSVGSATLGGGPGAATFNASGGSFDVAGAIQLGPATYTQTGGTVTAAQVTATFTGSATTANIFMSGGSLTAPGTSDLSYGAVFQSGGTFHVGRLRAWEYTLQDHGALMVDSDLLVGVGLPSATFTQSGGTTTVGGQVILNGSVTFSGGTFTAAGPLTAHHAGLQAAPTVINQTAGDVRVASLALGSIPVDFTTTYSLSGGTLTATNGASTIGSGGQSPISFLQSGGTFTGSSLIVNGDSRPSTYRLDGGNLRLSGGLTLQYNALYYQTAGDAQVGGAFVNDATYPGAAILPGSSLTGGTLTAGSFENHGVFTFSGGTLNAPASNVFPTGGWAVPPTFILTGLGTRTLSTLFNAAIVRAETTSVQFTGNVTNTAAYVSSYSTNTFVTLTNGPAAYLQGGRSDSFRFTGDLLSSSTNAANWQTTAATMEFQPNGSSNAHTLNVTGVDMGADTLAGYANNFAWGTLQLDSGQSLILQDGNATPGGALYVDVVSLADGLAQINDITGNGLDIYYNASDPLNAYLGGQTYPLVNGGFLIGATPEPGALGGMLALAVAGCVGRRRRRQPR